MAVRPLPGFFQPFSPADVRQWLDAIGPVARYGLRTIHLRGAPAVTERGLVFAEYVVPGEIVLYAVPPPPWRLPYALSAADSPLFRRYGASVLARPHETRVEWPAEGLAAFYRCEVLTHELGHHLLQLRKARRCPVARRSDHEAAADLFVVRERRKTLTPGPSPKNRRGETVQDRIRSVQAESAAARSPLARSWERVGPVRDRIG